MKTMLPLLKMEFIATKRNIVGFAMGIGMPLAFFLFFSGMYQFDNEEIKKLAVRTMMFSMTAFSAISFSFFSLPYSFLEDQQNNWRKMLAHSPLPAWQYALVRYLRICCSMVLSILVVFSAGYFLRGVSLSSKAWLLSAALLFLGSIIFIALGLPLTLIKKAELLSAVGNIVYLGLAMLGGLWFPVQLFPDWMRTLAHFTPTYHLNNWVTTYVNKNTLAWESLAVLLGYAIIAIGITCLIRKGQEVKS